MYNPDLPLISEQDGPFIPSIAFSYNRTTPDVLLVSMCPKTGTIINDTALSVHGYQKDFVTAGAILYTCGCGGWDVCLGGVIEILQGGPMPRLYWEVELLVTLAPASINVITPMPHRTIKIPGEEYRGCSVSLLASSPDQGACVCSVATAHGIQSPCAWLPPPCCMLL